MAKVVSVVPKLLTSTLGALASAPPKPVAIAAPVPVTPVVITASDDKPANTMTDSIVGPDLAEDLSSIETRGRGRLGTITTSFRGVLSDSASVLPRRTLLGE